MDAVNRTRYKEDRLKCFEFNARILVQLQIFCTIDLLLHFGISHRNLSISVLIRFTNPNFVWIDFILMLVAKLKRRNKTLLFVPIQIYCCKQTNEATNICKLWPHLFLNCECMCVSSTSNTMFNSIFFSAWFSSWSLCHFSLASFFTSKMHNKSFTGRLKLFVLRARLTKKIPMYSQGIWDSYERERTYSFEMKKEEQILILVVSFMKIWNVKFWHFLNKAKLRGFK